MSVKKQRSVRVGSFTWALVRLQPGEFLLQGVGSEGVQARQSMNMATITRLHRRAGCEHMRFTQRVFYGINPETEETLKLVRITRVDGMEV